MPFLLRVKGGADLPAGKIVGIGKNYEDHRKEMAGALGSGAGGDQAPPEDPVVFLKPSTSLLHDGGTLHIPPGVANVHWETELAVVIGETMKNVPQKEALRHVLGYGVLLDMTARDLQAVAKRAGLPWALSKGMDGFTPMSEVVRAADAPAWDRMEIRLLVNGEVRQESPTGAMIHPVPRLLAFLSRHMTLEPGDVLATGTPAGVGPCQSGDVLEAELVGLARVRVTVA